MNIETLSLLERQLLAKGIIQDAFLIANALIDSETSTDKKVLLASSRLGVMSTFMKDSTANSHKESKEE